ncbi:MAG: hypothetical protein ACK56I_05025, partial [bacterium]
AGDLVLDAKIDLLQVAGAQIGVEDNDRLVAVDRQGGDRCAGPRRLVGSREIAYGTNGSSGAVREGLDALGKAGGVAVDVAGGGADDPVVEHTPVAADHRLSGFKGVVGESEAGGEVV